MARGGLKKVYKIGSSGWKLSDKVVPLSSFDLNCSKVSVLHFESAEGHIKMTEILVSDTGRFIDDHCLVILESQQYKRLGFVNQSHFALPSEHVIRRG